MHIDDKQIPDVHDIINNLEYTLVPNGQLFFNLECTGMRYIQVHKKLTMSGATF